MTVEEIKEYIFFRINYNNINKWTRDTLLHIESMLDELEERPTGKWSEKQVCYTTPDNDFGFGWECSHCKAIINKGNYCSNCGAKMEVEE